MTHPGDKDYDPLRHNYAKRTEAKRNADDLKYGVPAMEKVKTALNIRVTSKEDEE